MIFDLHERRTFKVRDSLVIRYKERNLIVSPFYQKSGGMAVDFLPAECAESKGTTTCIQTAKE